MVRIKRGYFLYFSEFSSKFSGESESLNKGSFDMKYLTKRFVGVFMILFYSTGSPTYVAKGTARLVRIEIEEKRTSY